MIGRLLNATLALTPIAATGAVLVGLAAYRPAQEAAFPALGTPNGQLPQQVKARVLSEHSITPGYTPGELLALQPTFAVPPKARHRFDPEATDTMRAALVAKLAPPEPEPAPETPEPTPAASGH